MADHDQNQDINANTNQLINLQQESFKELQKVIGEQESRIQNLQNSAFQLANYYFVFQGVVLASVSNTSSLTCSDAWYIFTLTLIAATLNLFALFSIASKYIRAMNLHDQTWCEYNRSLVLMSTSTQNNHLQTVNVGQVRLYWRDKFSEVKRHVVLGACVVLFLGFTGVTLAGPWRVTCTHDHLRIKHPYGDDMDDCFKLCNVSRCMVFCNYTK